MLKNIVILCAIFLGPISAHAAGDAAKPPKMPWSYEGFFGTYDRASLQRGFQVFNEVCASCHSIEKLAYRHLEQIGIPPAGVKALAAEKELFDGFDEEGEHAKRAAKPSDKIVGPYRGEKHARASNNGSLPPDLSLINKARVGGANYIYAYLTGYKDEAPQGMEMQDGMYYNTYFAGNQTAMAPPLTVDRVSFSDGTPASVEQMAKDVTAFLQWAADPKMEERKRMGFKVMLFMFFFTLFLYMSKRKVWKRVQK